MCDLKFHGIYHLKRSEKVRSQKTVITFYDIETRCRMNFSSDPFFIQLWFPFNLEVYGERENFFCGQSKMRIRCVYIYRTGIFIVVRFLFHSAFIVLLYFAFLIRSFRSIVMELRVVVTVAVSKVAATMSGGGCGDSGRQAGIAFIHSCTCMNVCV